MPTPAGTGLSRRAFLARSSGLALSVFGGVALSRLALEEGIAAAQSGSPSPVLVSIFLSGGLDSLSVLAPIGDPRYAALRPDLALTPSGDATDVFTEDDRLHWHPSAGPLRDLHRAGKVSVMPAIGYTGANQSHFTSRHYWEVGRGQPVRAHRLARALSRQARSGRQPAAGPLARLQPRTGAGRGRHAGRRRLLARVLLARRARRLGRHDPDPHGRGAERPGHAWPPTTASSARARRAAAQTVGLRGQLTPLQGTDAPWQTAVPYPSEDGFARRLAVLAEMLDLGLPLKVVALDANGGYDTHDNQNGSLPADLAEFSQSLAAFQADLEARGLADRVLINVWSEFGRRPEENGSGTDHGAAGLSMVIGTRAKGTMVGEFPGLASSTRTTTCATRPTSAPSTARCSSNGSGSTPRGSSPRPRPSPARLVG